MLNQRHKHLLHLRSSWITPFASAVRYDSHIATADSIVASLVNGSMDLSLKSLIWTQEKHGDFSICTSTLPEEESEECVGSWNEVHNKTTHPDSDEVMVQDILIDDGGEEEIGDSGSGEVEVLLPDINFISSCPVSQFIFAV